MDIKALESAAADMRRDVITMTYKAGNIGAHIGGGLSLIEIMTVLYLKIMRLDPKNPLWDIRDRMILSKGHGAIAMYAALRQVGYLTYEQLLTYKQNGSYITAHPTLAPEKGSEFASGSLGQGLALGVGTCLGLKFKQNEARVFVIHGDGECDEGSVWEAAAAASHYELNNLVSIVDRNNLQYDGETKDVLNMEDMAEKWSAFGWETHVVNGHDLEALCQVLSIAHDKPLCVIADTVKGKGVSFIENNYRWHNGRLSDEQYKNAMKEQGVEL